MWRWRPKLGGQVVGAFFAAGHRGCRGGGGWWHDRGDTRGTSGERTVGGDGGVRCRRKRMKARRETWRQRHERVANGGSGGEEDEAIHTQHPSGPVAHSRSVMG
jgi:hypothetical protein